MLDNIIFIYSSFIGSVAFALSGYMLGVRKELDIVGLFIVAMLTANGGGAVRDVLLGQTPSVLIDLSAFYLVIAVIFFSYIFKIHRFSGLERRNIFVVSDSIGLVAFSITGALAGIEADLSFFGVLVLAFITATGGGIIRDIIINEVPTLLSSGFYASVALLIASGLYFINKYSEISNVNISFLFVLAISIRLVAHFRDWHLPRIRKGWPYISEQNTEDWR